MLPGSSGFRWMPRKMAGIAMITIEASIVAIVMLSVVLDRATHLYRSGRPPVAGAEPFTCPESTLCRTLTQSAPDTCLMATIDLGSSSSSSGRRLVARRVVRARGGRGVFHDVVDGDE